MIARRIAAIVAVLWLAGLGSPTLAQQPGPPIEPAAGVVEELAGLGRSMDRLVILLERVLDNQRVELVLRRIDLKHRRLAPLESDLRGTQSQIFDGESQIEQLRTMAEDERDKLREKVREGADPADNESARMIEGIEKGIKHEEGRVADLKIRAQELENELGSSRREIAILDDLLKELVE